MPLANFSEVLLPSLVIVLCAVALIVGLGALEIREATPQLTYFDGHKAPVTFAERFP